MKGALIALVLLLALVATFAVQNPGIITVKFLHLDGATSLLVVVVAAFAAGVLGGWLAGLPGYFRRRSEASTARQKIRELKAEIENLGKKAGGGSPGGAV